MILLPIGVLWAGYTVVWYGFALLKGKGMGINDLIIPGRLAHAQEVIAGWSSASDSQPATPPFVDSPGVQPGSDFYPKQPATGGLPAKPPLGSTPPAYYG